jgi:AraC family transcriptional regulator, regulatory protein of adaptative response / methylated-DNA-[protein]-cysteine methyltransferase
MSTYQISVPIATKVGVFLAHYSARGLARLEFPRRDQSKRIALAARRTLPALICRWHRRAVRAVGCVLAGKAVVDLPPLDLSAGTLFQQSVWGALRRILPGKTLTYAQVARTIRKPEATRSVGSACGANPIPILIPCHRVLRTDGQLGGFSAGLKWKRLLLTREGVWPRVGSE